MIEPKKGDGPLVAHARRELQLGKLFDKTETYDGSIARASLALVKTFEQWTKGNGPMAQAVHQCLSALLGGELLSPPTTEPDEWETIERDGKTVYRNKRSPFYMSNDPSHETWAHMGTGEKGMSKNHITGEVPDVTKTEELPVEKSDSTREKENLVAGAVTQVEAEKTVKHGKEGGS